MGVNEFSDLTPMEFQKIYVPTRFNRTRERREVWLKPTTEGSVDWREKGAVTPVKNQLQCGSCWAFSTTGSVEGSVFINTGKLMSLSEQQLVDCSASEGNNGCNGGLMDYGFKYIEDNKGIDTEVDYPYTAKTGRCDRTKANDEEAQITGFSDVPQQNEEQLAAAVAKGPVSVAIEADQSAFQHYRTGVFDGTCGTKLDHGVLVVGYTSDYWIVKNSWGATWGDEGFIYMKRGVSRAGICGIASQPSYPTGGKLGPGVKPGPSPGPTPKPSDSHYEDPYTQGCASDEVQISIQGVSGAICVPQCGLFKRCPAVDPSEWGGDATKAACILQDASSGQKYCAIECDPNDSTSCRPTAQDKATCKPIQGVGICTYDESETDKKIVNAKLDLN